MSILDRLRDARCEYVRDNGSEPKALYLGSVDRRQLQEATSAGAWVLTRTSPAGREHFDGLPVFVVDSEFHVGFGGDFQPF